MDIQQITEKHQLTQTEKRVLEYMEFNRYNLKKHGIRYVAKKTYTSPSFIVKLAKKMQLSGYSELVFLLSDTDYFDQDNQEIIDIRPYFERFYHYIVKHRNSMIMLLGNGYSQNIANYMSEYLNLHGFRSTSNSHLELLRKEEAADCLLIIISNSGETIRLCELLSQAKYNNQDIIAFVGNRTSSIAKKAKLVISTDTCTPSSFDSKVPQLFFGLSLMYFELLMCKSMAIIDQKEALS